MNDKSKLEYRVEGGDITAVLVDGSRVSVVTRTRDEKSLTLMFFKAIQVKARCSEFKSDLSHIEVVPADHGGASASRLFRFVTAKENAAVIEVEAEDQKPRML